MISAPIAGMSANDRIDVEEAVGAKNSMAVGAMNAVSARNQMNGQVAEIRAGEAMSLVTITANGRQLTSAITNQAVQDLGLKANDSVVALVKSTETMLIKGDAAGVKISAQQSHRSRHRYTKRERDGLCSDRCGVPQAHIGNHTPGY